MENTLSAVINAIENRELDCILLDFDGVLTCLPVDWDEVRREVSKLLSRNVESLRKLFKELFGTHLFDVVSSLVESREFEALRDAPLNTDLVALIREAKERGLKVFIVTHQSSRVVATFLRKFRLEDVVDGILTRDVNPEKRCLIEILINTRACRRSRTVLLDDSPRNVDECRRTGIVTLLFSRSWCNDFESLRIYV